MSFPADIPGIFDPPSAATRSYHAEHWGKVFHERGSDCYIERVVFCKVKGTKQHEFLKIYIRHPRIPSAKAMLVIERSPEINEDTKSLLVDRSKVLSPSLATTPANDIVRVGPESSELTSTNRYGSYVVLSELKFTGTTAPSASQLAKLLETINLHAPHYVIFQYQCYWFAYTVYTSIKQIFRDCQEIPGNHKKIKQSQYHGLAINVEDSVETVVREYMVAWQAVEVEAREREAQALSNNDAFIERGIEIGTERGREEGIEIGTERGREEGIEIGTERGREEGIEIGMERGREEGKKEAEIRMERLAADNARLVAEMEELRRQAGNR